MNSDLQGRATGPKAVQGNIAVSPFAAMAAVDGTTVPPHEWKE